MNLYIIYQKDHTIDPVLAVCKSPEEVEQQINNIVEEWIQEALSEVPAESGLNAVSDLDWLRQDCRRALGIQTIFDFS